MIETWAIIAIAAAFFQNLRSALQKHLKGSLSDTAAAYTRFLYALPFTLLYLYALQATGHDLPSLNLKFLGYCLLGGIAQILFTVILLRMFSYKSFAVGTTFSKLEVVFVAALGALLLKDLQTAWTLVGISLCVSGVVMLSIGKTGTRLYKDVFTRTTAMGLVCAFFLGASVVFFRAAALALNHHSVITSAAAALVAALIIQTLLMGMWLAYTAIEQWKKILQQWKWATVVGIAGTLASIGWFTAFTMHNASHVRAVGTIELLFTYVFSTRLFREKVSISETAGIALVAAGILFVVLSK